jgi:hypothetical protein
MAIDFPSGPSVGQTYTYLGRTWQYNAQGGWQRVAINLLMNDIPDGRITLTSGTPVLSATTTGAATVYYTPYCGNNVPIYDGTNWTLSTFSELSNVLANSSTGSAGPAAGAASKNYDLFVWNNAGTMTLTRGGAWNSDTARSSATENDLERISGILMNKNTITNGPAADRGTYVGTIRTDSGAAQVSYNLGGIASGGTAGNVGLWNMYNRVPFSCFSGDSTDSWTYATTTWRATDGSSTFRTSFIVGQAEEIYYARNIGLGTQAGGAAGRVAVCLDATNSFSGITGDWNVTTATTAIGTYEATIAIGWHFISGVEYASAATVTYNGDGGAPASIQTGMYVGGRF